MGVVGADEQPVLVEGPVAAGARQRGAVLDPRPAILPQTGAVAHVQRLDVVARLHQEHDAVVDERRGLLQALGHGPRPGETQAAHVGRVDLVERAVAPVVVGAPPHRPVARRRVDEHLLGHRRVVVDGGLRRGDRSREQKARRDQSGKGSRELSHRSWSSRQWAACRIGRASNAPWARQRRRATVV